MTQCHPYASLVSDILYSTLFLIHISTSGNHEVYYNICMKEDLKSVITRIEGQCVGGKKGGKGEHTLQISYVSIIKGVLLCLLVSTKAFRKKFHASFIYRDARDGVERWARLDRVVRYGIGVLSEGLHHES